MDKKQFEEQTFIDRRGYRVWRNSNKSVHRGIARDKIWAKDRKKYPLEFKEYQVHHKDGIKLNNKADNLELIQIRDHELKHNIHRHEYQVIKTGIVFIVMLFSWFVYLNIVSKYQLNPKDAIFMSSTLIAGIILIYFINKKKKGRRYV